MRLRVTGLVCFQLTTALTAACVLVSGCTLVKSNSCNRCSDITSCTQRPSATDTGPASTRPVRGSAGASVQYRYPPRAKEPQYATPAEAAFGQASPAIIDVNQEIAAEQLPPVPFANMPHSSTIEHGEWTRRDAKSERQKQKSPHAARRLPAPETEPSDGPARPPKVVLGVPVFLDRESVSPLAEPLQPEQNRSQAGRGRPARPNEPLGCSGTPDFPNTGPIYHEVLRPIPTTKDQLPSTFAPTREDSPDRSGLSPTLLYPTPPPASSPDEPASQGKLMQEVQPKPARAVEVVPRSRPAEKTEQLDDAPQPPTLEGDLERQSMRETPLTPPLILSTSCILSGRESSTASQTTTVPNRAGTQKCPQIINSSAMPR